MLVLLGDIHGGQWGLINAHARAVEAGATAVIQLGDFGVYAKLEEQFAALTKRFSLPTYFVDGNHEQFTVMRNWSKDELTEWVPNCFYVPRGKVLELDGRRIAFMGGAGSIDKDIRLRHGWHWYPDEQITIEDVLRFSRNVDDGPVDFMVTHCPPQVVITEHFDKPNPTFKTQAFGVSPDWSDPSATVIEKLWTGLGKPQLYCGHMHRSVTHESVRILDIDELALV